MNRPAWLVRSRTVFKPVHYDSKLHSVFGNQSDNFLIHFLKSNSQQITNEDSYDHPRPGSRCLIKVLSWRKRRKPVCRWRVSKVKQNITDDWQGCFRHRKVSYQFNINFQNKTCVKRPVCCMFHRRMKTDSDLDSVMCKSIFSAMLTSAPFSLRTWPPSAP